MFNLLLFLASSSSCDVSPWGSPGVLDPSLSACIVWKVLGCPGNDIGRLEDVPGRAAEPKGSLTVEVGRLLALYNDGGCPNAAVGSKDGGGGCVEGWVR